MARYFDFYGVVLLKNDVVGYPNTQSRGQRCFAKPKMLMVYEGGQIWADRELEDVFIGILYLFLP